MGVTAFLCAANLVFAPLMLAAGHEFAALVNLAAGLLGILVLRSERNR